MQGQAQEQLAKDHKAETNKGPRWLIVVLTIIVVVGIVVAIKSMSGPSEPVDPIVVTVNTQNMYQSYVDRKYNELGPTLREAITYDEFVEQLVDQRILVQQAQLKGLKVDPSEVMQQYNLLLKEEGMTKEEFREDLFKKNLTEDDVLSTINNNLLIDKLIQNSVVPNIKVTNQEIKELYDLNKETFTVQEAVHASHILVETEQDANDILQQLVEGADFFDLAAQYSIDPSVSENGGDLGYFEREMMIPEFADAAFEMEPGMVSKPIQTQFGWHIIAVHDKKQDGVLDLAEVEDLLRDSLKEERLTQASSDFLDLLKKNSTITYHNKEK